MRTLDITHRLWLADEYQQRHQVDRDTALDAVNDAQRRGTRSPHYDDVLAPARERLDAITPVLDHVRQQWKAFTDLMQPLVEWAQTEEGQAQLAQWRQEREEEARLQSCNCLCQVSHGMLGVCEGEATQTLVRVTPTLGRVEIPVCAPCQNATLTPAT